MAAKKSLTFEEKLKQVESMITAMENGGMSLEESVKKYEEGMKLLKELDQQLQQTERRLTEIRGTAGDHEEVPMEGQE